MEIYNIVKRIIYLPVIFRSEENVKSFYSLLKETGYFEVYNQISEDMLIKALVEHQECIDQWIFWSEDKRASSGWAFYQNDHGKYIVEFYNFDANPKINEQPETIEFSDKTTACAAFIKREIEDTRKL